MTIHKTVDGKMTQCNSVSDGCWVNLINPSEDELKTVAATMAVEPSFLRAPLGISVAIIVVAGIILRKKDLL